MHKNRFFNYRHAVAIAIMFLGLCFQATTAVGQNNQNGNSAARVGIDAAAPAPITLNEAIRLTLANNNDIGTSEPFDIAGVHDHFDGTEYVAVS